VGEGDPLDRQFSKNEKEEGKSMRPVHLGTARLLFVGLAMVTFVSLAMVAFDSSIDARTPPGLGGWQIAGRDLDNSRSQPSERQIGTKNVHQLVPKWVFTTGSDVSATPTIAGNTVYFPDWAGNLYAVRANDGRLLWSRKISDYNGRTGSISRVSPAIFEDQLIIGDHTTAGWLSPGDPSVGAHVIAVDRQSGALRWITQVDEHPAALITGSPVFHGNTVYVGVSSQEEGLATNPAYPCCTFRGSMVALDVFTGAILWKTFTVPDNGGLTGSYSGNAIWSPPALDPRRGSLYIGVGNNYTVPDAVLQCQQAAIDSGTMNANCTAPDDHFDSVLALDLMTGAIKWARRLSGFDVWTVACLSLPPGVNCPSPHGPDFDFPGSGPNLLHVRAAAADDDADDDDADDDGPQGRDRHGKQPGEPGRDLVGIGQKSGMYFALNPDNGAIVWSTVVGPGGTTGGIQWGTATDGTRIYVPISNSLHTTYTLANGGPTINYGSWAALDPRTGRILWQVPDPTPGTVDPGAVSVANGVLYAGSYSGAMYAIDARTGAVLFTFASGGSVVDAPSIVKGTVYWGSGYRTIAPGVGNNKVYAFTIPKGPAGKPRR
jgi:polyvinyl alcohol dehydrogenase (cytochrome)